MSTTTAAATTGAATTGAATTAGYARLRRRETHSPRSGLAITLAVVLVVVLAWVGTETVLSLLRLPALLIAPGAMARALVTVTSVPGGYAIASAAVLAVIGVVLVVAALAPARRARHTVHDDRLAVVIDNEVIASALARHASHAAGVDPDNTTVAVSHRRAEVSLIPSSGVPVAKDEVEAAVSRQLAQYQLVPAVSPRINISQNGRVGA